MRIIAERAFTAIDQSVFAELSGDANPMHIDPVAARRTMFGAPVVHGVHLLLWSLESWVQSRPSGPAALTRITASFKKGVLVGAGVQAAVVSEGDQFDLTIWQGVACMTTIQGRLWRSR